MTVSFKSDVKRQSVACQTFRCHSGTFLDDQCSHSGNVTKSTGSVRTDLTQKQKHMAEVIVGGSYNQPEE